MGTSIGGLLGTSSGRNFAEREITKEANIHNDIQKIIFK